jgi:hypothetical protein
MDGKALQVGSKVRVPEYKSSALGVAIPAFTGTITEILEDAKGLMLRLQQRHVSHDRAVRPAMVSRRRFKAAAA